MTKIVVCPDSFKGTLTSPEAAEAIRRGIMAVVSDVEIIILPVGDGGEGTADALAQVLPYSRERLVDTIDPLGRPIKARYFVVNQKTALIESAAASGLVLLKSHERDIMRADTRGTGRLIADAYQSGIRNFIICMGGTVTCDAGYGAWKEMKELEMTDAEFTLLCDVENPLLGSEGAAVVFGPQKGATSEDMPRLESLLTEKAEFYETLYGHSVKDASYGGAAGGLAAMLMACFGAVPCRGIEKVLAILDFDEIIKDADLVITGEGRVDSTTLHGKAPRGILEAAQRRGIPVAVIGGKIADRPLLCEAGFYIIEQATPDRANPITTPAEYVEKAASRIMKRLNGMQPD